MAMIVSDASPLIALSKIQRLGLLRSLYEQVLISPAVRSEVLGSAEHVRPAEVAPVRTAMREGWIKEVPLKASESRFAELLSQNASIHRGEAESIALATLRRLLLIVDDKEARVIAASNQASFIGTAAVLLEGYLRNLYPFEELEEAVRELGRVIWLSSAVATEIFRRAREAGR